MYKEDSRTVKSRLNGSKLYTHLAGSFHRFNQLQQFAIRLNISPEVFEMGFIIS